MNKTILIALALVVLVGGGFYVSKQMKPASPSSSTETTQSTTTKGSLRSLLSLGQNTTCTIANPDGSTGTVFVSAGRVRGDFDTQTDKGAMMTHMIQSDGYMYLWQEGETQGMKVKFDETTSTTDQTTQGNVDLDSEVDLSCVPWVTDGSKFTPPSGVVFTELSAMLQSDDAKKAMQAACEQITDPQAKATCLQNFGGN